jgi:hypothetical protein
LGSDLQVQTREFVPGAFGKHDAGSRLDAGLELAGKMTPGKIPTRPPPAPFGGAGWSYGSVPPEVE